MHIANEIGCYFREYFCDFYALILSKNPIKLIVFLEYNIRFGLFYRANNRKRNSIYCKCLQ